MGFDPCCRSYKLILGEVTCLRASVSSSVKWTQCLYLAAPREESPGTSLREALKRPSWVRKGPWALCGQIPGRPWGRSGSLRARALVTQEGLLQGWRDVGAGAVGEREAGGTFSTKALPSTHPSPHYPHLIRLFS